MATEASAAPEVFARKATGLRREASARDVFIYNTNNQNVGIGVTFMVLLIPALYVGGSMITATILAGKPKTGKAGLRSISRFRSRAAMTPSATSNASRATFSCWRWRTTTGASISG